VCLKSQEAFVMLGGRARNVTATSDMIDGENMTVQCSEVATGYSGTTVAKCALGVLTADASECSSNPCAPIMVPVKIGSISSFLNVTNVTEGKEVASGTTLKFDVELVHADYHGTAILKCLDGIFVPDLTDVLCKRSGCLTKSCGIFARVGVLKTEQYGIISTDYTNMQHKDTETRNCGDHLYGHMGAITLSCNMGILAADTSQCAAKPCEAGTPATLVASGLYGNASIASAVPHGQTTEVQCNEVNPATSYFEVGTCSFGTIVAPGGGSACLDYTVTRTTSTTTLTTTTTTVTLPAGVVEIKSDDSNNNLVGVAIGAACFGVCLCCCWMFCCQSRPKTQSTPDLHRTHSFMSRTGSFMSSMTSNLSYQGGLDASFGRSSPGSTLTRKVSPDVEEACVEGGNLKAAAAGASPRPAADAWS